MIGVRVECDAEGCGRHFAIDGRELRPMPAVATRQDRAAVMFALSLVMLPEGWAAGEEEPGVLRVLCAAHAPAERERSMAPKARRRRR